MDDRAIVFALVAAAGMGFAQQDEAAPLNIPSPVVNMPMLEIPPELRVKNYDGGSCYHASTEVAMYMQGMFELGDWWRANYSYGEYTNRLVSRLNARGVDIAYTTSGDVEFLEWCSRTRRVAAIPYYPNHAINFVCFFEDKVILLDNNAPHRYVFVDKSKFIYNWKNLYGGDAVTVVGTPLAPFPRP